MGVKRTARFGSAAGTSRFACFLTCLLACTGDIHSDPSSRFAPGAGSQAGVGAASSGQSGGGANAGAGGAGNTTGDQPSPATRAARLTHLQYENTLAELFEIDDAKTYTTDLRLDPAHAGFMFDNDSISLSVDEALYTGYQRSAGSIAQRVVADSALLARIAPPSESDAARAEVFVRDFGLRVHRRPLEQEDVDAYLALYAMGPALDARGTPFNAGVRLVLEAMLQSPFFLYRIEQSATEQAGAIALDDYEIASRLSYALWNSMPDAALFDAAEQGALADAANVAQHAERMLNDPRAKAMVQHFHSQLFETEGFANIQPSRNAFPNVSPQLGAFAIEESERFVSEIVFAQSGGYRDMLTSSDTFVNAELARIYGLSGSFGEGFVKAALDPSERRGIFTQVGFLASNATSTDPDPIHRGVFLARRIVCLTLAPPPANVPPVPPTEGRTNRETIEEHTQQPGSVCRGCHLPIINPLGFPFERFNAIGASRSEDNGHAIDATSNAPMGVDAVAVDGALELADALAASVDVHGCYAKHWIEMLNGRAATTADAPIQERLGAASQRGELSIRALITALVTSPAFLTRSTEEL